MPVRGLCRWRRWSSFFFLEKVPKNKTRNNMFLLPFVGNKKKSPFYVRLQQKTKYKKKSLVVNAAVVVM